MESAATAFDWITADRVVALGVAVQAIAILVGLVFARRQLAEAQQLRVEQVRPHVVIDVSPREGTGNLLYISMQNIGRTVARQVSVTFDPPLVSTIDEGGVRSGLPALRDLELWKETPTLPPGRSIECLYEIGHDRYERRDEMPDRTTATVCYRGDSGQTSDYVEQFVIDLGVLWGLTRTGELYMTDLVQSARKIEGHLGRMNRVLDLGEVRVIVATDDQSDLSARGLAAAPDLPENGPPASKSFAKRIRSLLTLWRSRPDS